MSLARLNAIALGWAINLIIIFEFCHIAGNYSLVALATAWVADMLTALKEFGYSIRNEFIAIPALASVLLTGLAIFQVVINH